MFSLANEGFFHNICISQFSQTIPNNTRFMKINKSLIANYILILIAIVAIGFIAQYYYTYWGTIHAQEASDVEVVLPENHPAISANSDLQFPAEVQVMTP